MQNGMTSLLWFVAIVAMIPVALWLLKRTPMGGAGGQGVMRSVAALPLSASQRIVTVEVGRGESRRWLVLGVTAQSITTLHTMAPQDDTPPIARPGAAASTPPAPAPAPLAASFAESIAPSFARSFTRALGKFKRDPGADDGR